MYLFDAHEADQVLETFAHKRKVEAKIGGAITWSDDMPFLKQNAPSVFPGQVMVLHACTGEGKSVFANWIARKLQAKLRLDAANAKKRILFAKLEETVELARASTMSAYPGSFRDISNGDADIERLQSAIVASADDQMLYVGPSIEGAVISDEAATFKPLTPQGIVSLKDDAKSFGLEISAVILDYIQLMKTDRRVGSRYEAVTEISMELIELAKNELKAPVFALAQSKLSEVKSRTLKIPNKEDIQHSSQIAEDADIVWSAWKPTADYPMFHKIKMGEVDWPVLRDMWIVKICKWRHVPIENEVMVLGMAKNGQFGEFYELDPNWVRQLSADDLRSRNIRNYWEAEKAGM